MIDYNHKNLPYIGVIGSGHCDSESYERAVRLGEEIAKKEAILICGGKSGIMKGACEGVKNKKGISIGVLPELDRKRSNDHLSLSITTGLGQGRNLLVVTSSDVLIAVAGRFGTLSEIALAQKHRIPTILLDSWPLLETGYNFDRSLLFEAASPKKAIEKAMQLIEKKQH